MDIQAYPLLLPDRWEPVIRTKRSIKIHVRMKIQGDQLPLLETYVHVQVFKLRPNT